MRKTCVGGDPIGDMSLQSLLPLFLTLLFRSPLSLPTFPNSSFPLPSLLSLPHTPFFPIFVTPYPLPSPSIDLFNLITSFSFFVTFSVVRSHLHAPTPTFAVHRRQSDEISDYSLASGRYQRKKTFLLVDDAVRDITNPFNTNTSF